MSLRLGEIGAQAESRFLSFFGLDLIWFFPPGGWWLCEGSSFSKGDIMLATCPTFGVVIWRGRLLSKVLSRALFEALCRVLFTFCLLEGAAKMLFQELFRVASKLLLLNMLTPSLHFPKVLFMGLFRLLLGRLKNVEISVSLCYLGCISIFWFDNQNVCIHHQYYQYCVWLVWLSGHAGSPLQAGATLSEGRERRKNVWCQDTTSVRSVSAPG